MIVFNDQEKNKKQGKEVPYMYLNGKEGKKEVKFCLHTQKMYDNSLINDLPDLCCPRCEHNFHLNKHGHYKRNLYLSEVKHIFIFVQRFICSCGKTFAYFPPEIVPYKRYPLKIITRALFLVEKYSIYQTEKILGISRSLLQYWQKQYLTDHKALVKVHNWSLENPLELAIEYKKQRLNTSFMQIISAKASP